MKKHTRVLSALLGLLMLCGIFAACRTGGGDKPGSGGTETVPQTGNYVADYLPDGKFEGRTFTVANFGDVRSFDISQDDATNTFDKAKYQRNQLIEARYGMEFAENLIASGYDEKQERYYARVCDGHANCVPASKR